MAVRVKSQQQQTTTTKYKYGNKKEIFWLFCCCCCCCFFENCHLLLGFGFLIKIIEYKCFVFGFIFLWLVPYRKFIYFIWTVLIKIFQALSKANICRLFFGLVFSKKNTRFLRFSSLALNVFCCVLCLVYNKIIANNLIKERDEISLWRFHLI